MKRLLLLAVLCLPLAAQTAINDTLYLQGATPWTGQIAVSWPAFTSCAGVPIARGSRTVAVNAGVVAISLWPSDCAAPSFAYSATYRTMGGANHGQTWAETWVVPSAPSIVTLATVRATSTLTMPWTSVSGKPVTFAPSAHASTHASGAADPITPAAIGAEPVDAKIVRRDSAGNVSMGNTLLAEGSAPINVKAYGAKGDGVIFVDGVMTSGSAALTSASSTFTNADVGKLIQVYGAVTAPAMSTPLFVGTGLSTMTAGGTYTGTRNLGYCVAITSTDHFSWGTYGLVPDTPSANFCVSGAASVAITGAAQTLSNGVTVTFGATTGYHAGDRWYIPANIGMLATTIASVTSAHVVNLTAPATATISGAAGAYGSDNATAIAAAIAAVPATGGVVYIPAGTYLSSTQTLVNRPYTALQGEASGSVLVYAGSDAIDGAVKFAPAAASPNGTCSDSTQCLFGVGVSDLSIRGNANAASALLLSATHVSSFRNVRLYDAKACFTSLFAVTNNYSGMSCVGWNKKMHPTRGFLYMPTNAFVLDAAAANATATSTTSTWSGTYVSGIAGTGVKLLGSFYNHFSGGEIEQAALGISAAAGAINNTFNTVDLEGLGTLLSDLGTNTQVLGMTLIPASFPSGISLPNNLGRVNGYTTSGVLAPLLYVDTSENTTLASYYGINLNPGNGVVKFSGTYPDVTMQIVNSGSGGGDYTITSGNSLSGIPSALNIYDHTSNKAVMVIERSGAIRFPSAGGSTNHTVCWKASGQLGYCSAVVAADGTCGTCQ